MQTRSPSKAAFTLVEIMIVVAIIGLLSAIVLPNFFRARTTSQRNACIVNLRQIDGAKETWALEKNWPEGTPTDGLGAVLKFLKNSALPLCPAGGTYTMNPVGTIPVCSQGNALGHTY